MLWHQKVPMRQLPVFPTLEDEDLILISRKSPRLEGLLSVQALTSVTPGPPGPPGPQGPPGSNATVTHEAIIAAGGLTTPESVSLGGNLAADNGKVLGFDLNGAITGSTGLAGGFAVRGIGVGSGGGVYGSSNAGGTGVKGESQYGVGGDFSSVSGVGLNAYSGTGHAISASASVSAGIISQMLPGSIGNAIVGTARGGIGGSFSSVNNLGLSVSTEGGALIAEFGSALNPSHRLYIESADLGFRWQLAANTLKLVPPSPTGSRTWNLPDASGTLALTNQLDSSVARFWACPGMRVRSPEYFPTPLDLYQVEVIGDVKAIPAQAAVDTTVLPGLPGRDERFPVWQSADKYYTMWAVADGDAPGQPALLLYGNASGGVSPPPSGYGAWLFYVDQPGLDAVLGLLTYEAVNTSAKGWDELIQDFSYSSTTQSEAEFHGPRFLVASIGGSGTLDAGKVVEFNSQGGLHISATSGPGVAGRTFGQTIADRGLYAEVSGDALGILTESVNGAAGMFNSNTGPGSIAKSNGVYIAEFWNGTSGTSKLQIERATLAFRYTYGARVLRLVPPAAATANRDWALPDASGTLMLTSQADASVTRFWACPVMQVKSATYFPNILNLPQVEVIGDIRNIFPDINTIDNEVGPYMPPRDERFPVWQTTDRRYTMWVTPDGGGIGNPTLVLYGDAPGAIVEYGAWMFGTGLPGLDSVLGLLEYQSVSMARLTWYLAVQAFVALSDYLVEDAEFHGPLFLDASVGGSAEADSGKAVQFLSTGGIRASAASGPGVAGRTFGATLGDFGLYAEVTNGVAYGLNASSVGGVGGHIQSHNGITGLRVVNNTGTNIAEFWSNFGGSANTLNIKRSTMILEWKMGGVLGSLVPTTLTGARTWNLPDDSGTILLTTTGTIPGAKSFTGQMSLTGQTAAAGTSAMTRDLVDVRCARLTSLATNSGSSVAVAAGDVGLMTELTNTGAITVTIGSGTSSIPTNSECVYRRAVAAGALTLTASGGMTIDNAADALYIPPGGTFVLKKLSSTRWILI